MRSRNFVNLTDAGYSAEELEFLQAVDRYQRENGTKFPDWVTVLQLVKRMGYRKVAPPVIVPPINSVLNPKV